MNDEPIELISPSLTVTENIELDKQLLEDVGAGALPPFFRIWKYTDEAVVIGVSQKQEDFVRTRDCENDGVQVLKRFSGGGAVFIGRGCLVYSVVRKLGDKIKPLDVQGAYRHILSIAIDSFCRLNIKVDFHRPCDLAVEGRKICGNAQAQKRGAVLVHGSFLINADTDRVSRYLKYPSVAPDYRAGRGHCDFLCNLSELGLSRDDVVEALRRAWAPGAVSRRIGGTG